MKFRRHAAQYLYWNTGGGDVRRSNLDGTNKVTLVAGENTPYGIAVTNSYLYWTCNTGPGGITTVRRANLDGTGVVTLVGGEVQPLTGIAVDANFIYYGYNAGVGNSRIRRCALDGTGLVTLVGGEASVNGVCVDSTYVYWQDTNLGNIRRATLAGAGVGTIAVGLNTAYGLAQDGTYLFSAENRAVPFGGLQRCPIAGAPPLVNILAGENGVFGCWATSAYVYFSYWFGGIKRCDKNGGGLVGIIAGETAYVTFVAATPGAP